MKMNDHQQGGAGVGLVVRVRLIMIGIRLRAAKYTRGCSSDSAAGLLRTDAVRSRGGALAGSVAPSVLRAASEPRQ